MGFCNGICSLCREPCYVGEVKVEDLIKKIQTPLTQEEERKASEVFDSTVTKKNQTSDTGLSVVENIDTYEVVRSIFGKEKVRKVK